LAGSGILGRSETKMDQMKRSITSFDCMGHDSQKAYEKICLLEVWWESILNAFFSSLSNDRAEGLNNKLNSPNARVLASATI